MLKQKPLYIFILLFTCIGFMIYEINTLSISYSEARLIYTQEYSIWYIKLMSNFANFININMKYFFILIYMLNVMMIYKISNLIHKNKNDILYSVAIFALLPGVCSAAVLINPSGLVILLTLIFVYLFMTKRKISASIILIISLFIDNSFIYLYLILAIYAILKKDYNFLYILIALLFVNTSIYPIDIHGKPSGHFIEMFGVYLAIFSPFIFIYFFYALYRILIKEEKNILWHISFGILVISTILSFRQRLNIEDFAPFVVIATPLMVQVFFKSFRSRIAQFRKKYYLLAYIVAFSLIINFLISFINKPIFLLLQNPQSHFAYKYYFVQDLANILKKKDIHTIQTDNYKLQTRLKYYGIQKDKGNYIFEKKPKNIKTTEIKISYFGKIVKTYYLKM